jgi:hypothetical protein
MMHGKQVSIKISVFIVEVNQRSMKMIDTIVEDVTEIILWSQMKKMIMERTRYE